MLPLVPGLFWSVLACENNGESIVAEYFSLELLCCERYNGERDRRHWETKAHQ